MRTILLSAACALGLALAASTGASAAPLGSALNDLQLSPLQEAQVVVIGPGRRHRPFCRVYTRCRVTPFGRRICRTERVCRRY
jgi:hypothetical protein